MRTRDQQILHGYLELLNKQHGWSTWCVPVSDRWKGPPSYYLLYLTKHRDGHWQFAQSISSALEKTRKRAAAMSGQLDFDPSAEWIDTIAANVTSMLADKASFVVQDELKTLHGSSLGWARQTHIRKALDRLYADG